MYHYIYQINVGKKFYIGKRSSEVEPHDDAYYGSGKIIRRYQKMFGTQGLQKIILETCWSEREAYQREAEIVTWKLTKDPDCLNIINGGYSISAEDCRRFALEREAKMSAEAKSARARKAKETLGPEGRRAVARKGKETLGPEKRSRITLKAAKTLGPEGLSKKSRKAMETMGKEGLSAKARKAKETLGPEGRKAVIRKGKETLGPEGRKALAKKSMETMGAEGLSRRSAAVNESLGEEGRSQRARKGNRTIERLFFDKYGIEMIPTKDPKTGKRTSTSNTWGTMIGRHKGNICPEWIPDGTRLSINGYQQFYQDMGEKVGTLARIDTSKPFSKENCYWDDSTPITVDENGRMNKTWRSWHNVCTKGVDNVDPEWMSDYSNFLRDMGEKRGRLTRIDKEKPYSKENCYWK